MPDGPTFEIIDDLIYPDPIPNVWEQCLNCDYWLSFGQECECHLEQGNDRGISY